MTALCCTSHDREKANALFEMDPDNIKDLEQQKNVDIHLTNDSKYVKKSKLRKGEGEGVHCLRWIRINQGSRATEESGYSSDK